MTFLIKPVCYAGAFMASVAAFAQDAADTYPNRPIRIIVTFPPGGPTDIIARAVGQKLTEAWGQPVVVDNRAGAGGNIGTDFVAKAAPDGYTLLLSNFGPLAISPFVYAKLPYDPVTDLAPITLAATAWFFVVTHPALPATTLKDLIALAKAKPDQIAFSSSGNASPSHLAGALFQSSAGIRLTHVPYKGGAPAVLGEFVITRQWVYGKSPGNAAASCRNSVPHRQDEVFLTSRLGCSH